MSLVELLRRRLGQEASSFQLMGVDLALLTGADLREAGLAWQAGVDALDPALRPGFVDEQAALQGEAHRFLRKYNRSVNTRIAGYLEIGRRSSFRYPWPVVAVLGIEQVWTALRRGRVYGFLGDAAARIGWRTLARIIDGSEDVLRRTNHGIFADSVPTVLYALRLHALASRGQGALATALAVGPLPPLFDEESRSLLRALADGLAIEDATERFRALALLTARHFAREQAIFTHQMGAREQKDSPLLGRMVALRSVPAPAFEGSAGERRLIMRPFALPRGFDMRDHAMRVEAFERAFVASVTTDPDDYRTATRYVLERFGRSGERLGERT